MTSFHLKLLLEKKKKKKQQEWKEDNNIKYFWETKEGKI